LEKSCKFGQGLVELDCILFNESMLYKRFRPPKGFFRVPHKRGTFAWWLRRLPLERKGAPVRYYDGRLKKNQCIHSAVVRLDIGRGNLQQCADALMRLWGEYL